MQLPPARDARSTESHRSPGYTYASVTDKISAIVLTGRTPRGWFIGFGVSFCAGHAVAVSIAYLLGRRRRHLGHQHPGGVGLCHHQLCLVDRYRACRHADFSHLVAAAPGMAHLDQPLCRGHDAFCRRLCWPLSALPSGASLVVLLAVSVSQYHGRLAAVSQPACLGRLRRLDLCHRLLPVLVCGLDPGPGNAARPRAAPLESGHLRHPGHGLAGLGTPLASLSDGLFAAGRAGHAAGGLGAYASSASTLPSPSSPAGMPRSFRPISWPARSMPGLPWS